MSDFFFSPQDAGPTIILCQKLGEKIQDMKKVFVCGTCLVWLAHGVTHSVSYPVREFFPSLGTLVCVFWRECHETDCFFYGMTSLPSDPRPFRRRTSSRSLHAWVMQSVGLQTTSTWPQRPMRTRKRTDIEMSWPRMSPAYLWGMGFRTRQHLRRVLFNDYVSVHNCFSQCLTVINGYTGCCRSQGRYINASFVMDENFICTQVRLCSIL